MVRQQQHASSFHEKIRNSRRPSRMLISVTQTPLKRTVLLPPCCTSNSSLFKSSRVLSLPQRGQPSTLWSISVDNRRTFQPHPSTATLLKLPRNVLSIRPPIFFDTVPVFRLKARIPAGRAFIRDFKTQHTP